MIELAHLCCALRFLGFSAFAVSIEHAQSTRTAANDATDLLHSVLLAQTALIGAEHMAFELGRVDVGLMLVDAQRIAVRAKREIRDSVARAMGHSSDAAFLEQLKRGLAR